MNLFDKPLTFLSDLFSNEKKNKDMGMLECILNSIEIKNQYLNEFNWKKYLDAYPDIILEEPNEMNAYKHWIEAGKFENRCSVKMDSEETYDRFEYESYLKVNPDLASVLNGEFELYHHWSNHGRYENRLVTSVESIDAKSNTIEIITIVPSVDFFVNPKHNSEWLMIMEDLLNEFDWKFYLRFYYDELVTVGITTYSQSFIHWCNHGKDEGRICFKSVDSFDEMYQSQELSNFECNNFPIYIINLKERIDKKLEMTEQFNTLNIKNYNFFTALDKEDEIVQLKYKEYTENYDKRAIRTTVYRSKWECKVIKSIGAMGLICSTIELFKQLEEKGINNVIIMEDDAQLHKSWHYMLKPLKTTLNDKELIYIGYNNHKSEVNKLLVHCNSDIIKKIPHDRTMFAFYGTFGYICNSQFRKKIIQLGIDWFIYNNCTIDYGYNILNWEKHIQSFVVTGEALVYPDVYDPDCINNKRENKENYYVERCINIHNYVPRIKKNIQFVFIIPSYNNEQWIEKNVLSVLNQTYENWKMIYINDNSTDKTGEKFLELTKDYDSKIVYLENSMQYGQAFNRYRAYNMCEDEDVCILLDGDDWLYHKNVLMYLCFFMNIHDVDVTYGQFNWFLENKVQPFDFPRDYDNHVKERKIYRKDTWRCMHLRTMKAKYLKMINALDFIDDNGDFITSSTDMVESFATLELCEGRHKRVDELLMIYNRDNSQIYPTSYYNSENQEEKNKVQNIVRNRKIYSNNRNEGVILIDIEEENYKSHINTYREDYKSSMDLFLVKGSELHFYVNKLNTYNDIQYLSE